MCLGKSRHKAENSELWAIFLRFFLEIFLKRLLFLFRFYGVTFLIFFWIFFEVGIAK
jgi:hypothetical protein